jgi:hypothetical protein
MEGVHRVIVPLQEIFGLRSWPFGWKGMVPLLAKTIQHKNNKAKEKGKPDLHFGGKPIDGLTKIEVGADINVFKFLNNFQKKFHNILIYIKKKLFFARKNHKIYEKTYVWHICMCIIRRPDRLPKRNYSCRRNTCID